MDNWGGKWYDKAVSTTRKNDVAAMPVNHLEEVFL